MKQHKRRTNSLRNSTLAVINPTDKTIKPTAMSRTALGIQLSHILLSQLVNKISEDPTSHMSVEHEMSNEYFIYSDQTVF